MTYTQRSRPNIVRNANINSGTAGSNSARPPQHVNPALPDPVIFDPNQEYNFCDDDVDKPRMVSMPVVKSTQLSTKLSTAVNSCCHRPPKKTNKKSSKLACMPLPRIGTSKKQSSDKKTEIKCNKMPSSSCYVKKSGDSDEVYGFTPNWPEDCPLQSRYNLVQLTLFRVSKFHFSYLMFLHCKQTNLLSNNGDEIEAELKFWMIDDTFVDPAMGSPAQFPKMIAAVLMNLLELRAPGVGVN